MLLKEIAHSRTGDKGNISVISVIAYQQEALNFVMEDALGGGVTRSLAIDMHGKTLGSALLEMKI